MKTKDTRIDNPNNFYNPTLGIELDIYPYIEQRIIADRTLNVHVAIDSKRRDKKASYVVAIILYSDERKKGAEVWYRRFTEKSPRDMFSRLWLEVELANDWANRIYTNLKHIIPNMKDITVHLDLNPDPKCGSNSAYKAGYPWIKGMGFTTLAKPESWGCRAADYFA